MILEKILSDVGIPRNAYDLCDGVCAHSREDDEFKYVFAENYTDKEQTARLSCKGVDIESGEPTDEVIRISPFGIRIIKIKK